MSDAARQRFRDGVWPARDELELRVGQAYLTLAALSQTIPTGTVVCVDLQDRWGRRTLHELRQHAIQSLERGESRWARRQVLRDPGHVPPRSIRQLVYDLVEEAAAPLWRADLGFYLVPAMRTVAGAPLAKRAALKMHVSAEWAEEGARPLCAVMVHLGVDQAHVRLRRQMLSASFAPGTERVVVDVRAAGAEPDADNTGAAVGVTRVSTLEQMAFTSTSEVDAGMLTMSEVVRSLRRRVHAAGPRVRFAECTLADAAAPGV